MPFYCWSSHPKKVRPQLQEKTGLQEKTSVPLFALLIELENGTQLLSIIAIISLSRSETTTISSVLGIDLLAIIQKDLSQGAILCMFTVKTR